MHSDEIRILISGGIGRITINRPERRNALTWDVVRQLRAAFDDVANDEDVRAIVLSGSGSDAFCAGADLEEMTGTDETAEQLHKDRGELARLFSTMWASGKPIVASVKGYALAGGFGLALACDIIVAADNAVFGAPEVKVGLWPFMVTVPMLHSMPPKRALELMLTGRHVDAHEGLQIGFVHQVVPMAEHDVVVNELLHQLVKNPPEAVRHGKTSFYEAIDLDADKALAMLHPMLTVVADSDEAKEGISAFKEKRPPSWSHFAP